MTALTLLAVFRLALRQTEGLISSIIGLLGPIREHWKIENTSHYTRDVTLGEDH